MKYTDPEGKWDENSDGSYTATKGDTLWGLQQKTGKDWHQTDYKGKPENLQIGQTVRYKSTSEKMDDYISSVGNITGSLSESAKNFGKAWYTTYSENSNQFVYPVRTLENPDLMNKSYSFGNINKLCLAISVVLNVYDGIKTGVKSDSFWKGAYRTAGNLFSTAVGYKIGGIVTSGLTAGTVGWGAIPGITCGVVAGTASASGVKWIFNKGEKLLWK